jgi:hypothetical protein
MSETDAGLPFFAFFPQPVHVERYREGIPLTAPSDPEQGGQCSLDELCRLGANTGVWGLGLFRLCRLGANTGVWGLGLFRLCRLGANTCEVPTQHFTVKMWMIEGFAFARARIETYAQLFPLQMYRFRTS